MGALRSAAQRLARSKEPLPEWRIGTPDGSLEPDDVIAALNGTSRIWAWDWARVLAGIEDSEFFRAEKIDEARCQQELTERLRGYVELWLATGRSRDGIETPTRRRPTHGIHHIVEHFHRTHHVIPVPLADGYTVLTVPPVDRDILGDERTVDYVPESDHGQTLAPLTVRRRGKPGNQFSVAEDAAQRMFVGMLMSEWRLRIARCWKCGVYFLLSHPKRTYPNGTHCSPCRRKRSLESAEKATYKARKEAERRLWVLAAKRFKTQLLKTANWHREPKFKAKIVEFLQRRIERSDSLKRAYPSGITGKWLSWSKNRNGIDKSAKGEIRC
jgi:hypothetical protein